MSALGGIRAAAIRANTHGVTAAGIAVGVLPVLNLLSNQALFGSIVSALHLPIAPDVVNAIPLIASGILLLLGRAPQIPQRPGDLAPLVDAAKKGQP